MIVSMRSSGLAHNSISSYCRVLRTFLNWCKRSGLNVPELPNSMRQEKISDVFGILGVFLCGIGIEVITDIKQLYALAGGASASCGATLGFLLVERPQTFFYFFFGKAPTVLCFHNIPSYGGFVLV